MRRLTLIILLFATGCHREEQDATSNATAGGRLETAAMQAGLITDPTRVDPVGAWARDTDRVCVLPGKKEGTYRIGALVDYGDGQGCAASGIAKRAGARLSITFDQCRFNARLEGDRLVFPASVPASCDRFCQGRASLDALTVDHLSTSTSEAATLRAPDRTPLCPG